jgi:Mce-associated membrane protein
VDLAGFRADGVTGLTTASDSTEPAANRSGSGSLLLLAGTAVLLIGLVVAAVLLGIRDHNRRQSATSEAGGTPTEQAVLAAARGEAVALTSLDYQTASTDLDRVLAGATGALRTQFEKEKSQLPSTLAKTKAVSRGTVLSSALSSISGSTATVMVAVDANVSGSDTGTTGVLKHYRFILTMQHVGNRWLANNVASAGQL